MAGDSSSSSSSAPTEPKRNPNAEGKEGSSSATFLFVVPFLGRREALFVVSHGQASVLSASGWCASSSSSAAVVGGWSEPSFAGGRVRGWSPCCSPGDSPAVLESKKGKKKTREELAVFDGPPLPVEEGNNENDMGKEEIQKSIQV